MSVLAIDIGGTSIKHALVTHDGDIIKKGKVPTPQVEQELFVLLESIKSSYEGFADLEGVAFSTPGIPNQQTGFINGGSALPYLHTFPFKQQVETVLKTKVSFENDATCAAYAEMWLGRAKKMDDIIMVVCGSGIGGAILKDGTVHRGANRYGGEFGYMIMNSKGETFSGRTSPVELAKRASLVVGKPLDAQQVFELAEKGDRKMKEEIDEHFYYMGLGLYNLQVTYDPEAIFIGGAISERVDYIDRIYQTIDRFIFQNPFPVPRPQLLSCQFGNDANLIGAVHVFRKEHVSLKKTV